MYIKQIQLQNFQAIKEFSGNFEGNVYLVTGENELGKSTLLKAIMTLLTGNRDEVLRNGEEKGFAKIVVGGDGKEYEVELRMTKANPRGTITIKSKDTGLRSDRVTALQEIFGYQDFDANEFVNWSETAEGRRKQVQIVKSLLPTETQQRIFEIDAESTRIKEQRKEDNSTLKTYSTLLAKAEKEIKPGDVETYSEALDLQELLEQQAQAVKLEEKAKSVQEKLAQREKTIAETPQKHADLDKKRAEALEARKSAEEAAKAAMEEAIEKAKQDYLASVNRIKKQWEDTKVYFDEQEKLIQLEEADAVKRRDNCKSWLENYEANKPADVSQKINDIQHHNGMHQKVEAYLQAKKEKDAAQAKVVSHIEKLNALSQERAQLIQDAKFPIAGLTFTEDGLELNGIPFVTGKVSDSQIMEVAARLIIAKNPTVKVFRIARGESLGKKKMEALVTFARENGFQGFVEQVVREQNELKVEEYSEK